MICRKWMEIDSIIGLMLLIKWAQVRLTWNQIKIQIRLRIRLDWTKYRKIQSKKRQRNHIFETWLRDKRAQQENQITQKNLNWVVCLRIKTSNYLFFPRNQSNSTKQLSQIINHPPNQLSVIRTHRTWPPTSAVLSSQKWKKSLKDSKLFGKSRKAY